MNFLGLPGREEARVALIPAPLELTTSWKKGTSEAPLEILKVSPNMEFFDDEFFLSPVERPGFFTYPLLELDFDIEAAFNQVQAMVRDALEKKRFPILIGGEHTVSLAGVSEVKKFFPELKLVHLDAHLDLRDSYRGTKVNHATVMRRIRDLGVDIISIGIRSICEEEYEFLKKNGHQVLWAKTWFESKEKVLNEIERFVKDDPVYLSLDVDVFDPSVVPGTGTPEPGGLFWWDVLEILKRVAKANLVAADLVEVRPLGEPPITEYLAAKLIFKLGVYLRVFKWRI